MICLQAVRPFAMIIIQSRGVSFPNSFPVYLVLFFFTHPVNLFFKELHLLRIIITNFILLPLLVLAALLHALLEDIKATEVLHVL